MSEFLDFEGLKTYHNELMNNIDERFDELKDSFASNAEIDGLFSWISDQES